MLALLLMLVHPVGSLGFRLGIEEKVICLYPDMAMEIVCHISRPTGYSTLSLPPLSRPPHVGQVGLRSLGRVHKLLFPTQPLSDRVALAEVTSRINKRPDPPNEHPINEITLSLKINSLMNYQPKFNNKIVLNS